MISRKEISDLQAQEQQIIEIINHIDKLLIENFVIDNVTIFKYNIDAPDKIIKTIQSRYIENGWKVHLSGTTLIFS